MSSISIVIPFYKAEAFFEDALQSILSQSHAPAEIIVVVDGDTATARRFFSNLRCSQLHVAFLAENRGAGAARNEGARLASSEWIAFMDADDLWKPQKLERQLAYLAANEAMVACHTGVEVFNEAGQTAAVYVDKTCPLLLTDLLLHGSQIVPSSFMMRREVFLHSQGFDESFRTSEDYEFSIRLVSSGYLIGFVPEALTRLRRADQGNLSSSGGRLLKHHIRMALAYRNDLWRVDGPGAVLRFLGRYLYEDGARMSGLAGLACRACGKLLGFVFAKRVA